MTVPSGSSATRELAPNGVLGTAGNSVRMVAHSSITVISGYAVSQCGWKDGGRGGSARCVATRQDEKDKINLTHTGLLMEGAFQLAARKTWSQISFPSREPRGAVSSASKQTTYAFICWRVHGYPSTIR